MADGKGMVEVYEKTTVELSYPSVARFTGHVQLKGLSERTVESYVCMIRQLAAWGKRDPAELTEEQVRDYFLRTKQFKENNLPGNLLSGNLLFRERCPGWGHNAA